tara:strand:+ start:447 stop:560 length:114 start_codon:yes stop_codon:yes gene_type:complete
MKREEGEEVWCFRFDFNYDVGEPGGALIWIKGGLRVG